MSNTLGSFMLPHVAIHRHRRLLGWWLVVLALCALSLQSLQHYQPQMLSEVCSVASGEGPSAPDGKVGNHGTDCGSCCARVGVAVVQHTESAPRVVGVSVDGVATPTVTLPASSSAWSPSRPRGPPRLA